MKKNRVGQSANERRFTDFQKQPERAAETVRYKNSVLDQALEQQYASRVAAPQNVENRRARAAADSQARYSTGNGGSYGGGNDDGGGRRGDPHDLGRLSRFFSVAVPVLLAVVSLAFIWVLGRSKYLPSRYLLPICLFILLMIIIVVILLLIIRPTRYKLHRVPRIIGYVLAVLMLLPQFYGLWMLGSLGGALHRISDQKTPTAQFSLMVLKDDPAQRMADVKDQPVAAVMRKDGEMVQEALKGSGIKELRNVGSYPELADALLKGEQRFIFFNETYRGMVSEGHPDFEARTRVLEKFDVKDLRREAREKEKEAQQNDASSRRKPDLAAAENNRPFVLYISGIDTYGPISSVSRSDVNILLAVNPRTHKVTMVSVPRDSYLPIAGGGDGEMDKLTHAGIYGVDASVETLENLFDISIAYYCKVNFSSLLNLVDKIGGIRVDNPVAFTASNGMNFDEGEIELNGEQALMFSRERYNLTGGDFDRGRNQQRVIKGILDKLMQPSVLLNFSSIFDQISESVDTNMSPDSIAALVRNQIDSGASWDIDSYQVSAHGETGLPSYAMPGYNLYMAVLDDDSVAEAKAVINAALGS